VVVSLLKTLTIEDNHVSSMLAMTIILHLIDRKFLKHGYSYIGLLSLITINQSFISGRYSIQIHIYMHTVTIQEVTTRHEVMH